MERWNDRTITPPAVANPGGGFKGTKERWNDEENLKFKI